MLRCISPALGLCCAVWLGVFACLPAHAENPARWEYLASDDEQYWFIDPATIQGKADLRSAWLLIQFVQPLITRDPQGRPGAAARAQRMRVAVDCPSRRQAIRESEYFSDMQARRPAIDRFRLTTKQTEFVSAPVGSMGEALIDRVCAADLTNHR